MLNASIPTKLNANRAHLLLEVRVQSPLGLEISAWGGFWSSVHVDPDKGIWIQLYSQWGKKKLQGLNNDDV